MNINSVYFEEKYLVIPANLITSSNQTEIIVLFKVNTGNDGNIITLCIYKKIKS